MSENVNLSGRINETFQHFRRAVAPLLVRGVLARIRPWTQFLAPKNFKAVSLPRLSRRFDRNVEHFFANYLIVFLGLFAYCLITTPLPLIAMAASAFGYRKLRKLTSGSKTWKMVAAAGFMAVCWQTGAVAVLFWALCVPVIAVAVHASIFDEETLPASEDPKQFPTISDIFLFFIYNV